MAGEDLLGVAGRTNRGVAALMFMGGVYIAYDTMSTLNSSPWTHETFGGEPGKAASAQRYVRLAISRSLALGALSSYIAGSSWPLVGVALADADLFWVYWQAKRKAEASGG